MFYKRVTQCNEAYWTE